MRYQVNLWGSHPTENNDDCITGWDFESRFDAVTKFTELLANTNYPFVEIIGLDVNKVERTKAPLVKKHSVDSKWVAEIAKEEGMLHGIEAYNEVRGW